MAASLATLDPYAFALAAAAVLLARTRWVWASTLLASIASALTAVRGSWWAGVPALAAVAMLHLATPSPILYLDVRVSLVVLVALALATHGALCSGALQAAFTVAGARVSWASIAVLLVLLYTPPLALLSFSLGASSPRIRVKPALLTVSVALAVAAAILCSSTLSPAIAALAVLVLSFSFTEASR